MRRNRRLVSIAATLGLTAAVLVGLPAVPAQAVLPTSACTVSGPLTARFASDFWGQPSFFPPFVQFQVSAGGGTYAGVFQDNHVGPNSIHLLYYSGGRVTFLDSYRESGAFEAIDGSMEAVGFDALGDVVARIQRGQLGGYNGWRYDLRGNKWMLQDSPLWNSVEPIGVSSNGTIVGNAYYRSTGQSQIVSWTGAGRGVVHLLSPIGYRATAVDQRGDIFYNQPNGAVTYVRQPTGRVNLLEDFGANPSWPISVVSHADYASAFGDTSGPYYSAVAGRWDVVAGSSAPIYPHKIGYLVHVDAVGLGGDVVGEYPGNTSIDRGTRVLVRSTGKAYRLPPQFLTSSWYTEPHTVVNRYGQVVYTGMDGLPHLFSCPA